MQKDTEQKMLAISLPSRLLEDFKEYALSKMPNEACGFLVGNHGLDQCNTSSIIYMENVEPSPSYFKMSDEDILDAYKSLAPDAEMIGVIHSHPFWPATPSSTDIANMKNNPGVWIITSFSERITRAFIYKNDNVQPVMINTYGETDNYE